MVRYLSVPQVVEVHRKITDLFFSSVTGAAPISMYGILSYQALDSAVNRPKQTYGGRDLYRGIYHKAAALLHSLVSNHPFLDGNKRTAITSTFIFLWINGIQIKPEPLANSKYVLKIATGRVGGKTERDVINNIARWLRRKAHPLQLHVP